VLVRKEIHGCKEKIGDGMQAINNFHVYYATSRPDDHVGEPQGHTRAIENEMEKMR